MEPLYDLLEGGGIRSPGGLVALRPSFNLPPHISFRLTEALKVYGLIVNRVKLVVYIQQVLAQSAHLGRAQFEPLGSFFSG